MCGLEQQSKSRNCDKHTQSIRTGFELVEGGQIGFHWKPMQLYKSKSECVKIYEQLHSSQNVQMRQKFVTTIQLFTPSTDTHQQTSWPTKHITHLVSPSTQSVTQNGVTISPLPSLVERGRWVTDGGGDRTGLLSRVSFEFLFQLERKSRNEPCKEQNSRFYDNQSLYWLSLSLLPSQTCDQSQD